MFLLNAFTHGGWIVNRDLPSTLVGVDYTPQTPTTRCDWVVVTTEEVGYVARPLALPNIQIFSTGGAVKTRHRLVHIKSFAYAWKFQIIMTH